MLLGQKWPFFQIFILANIGKKNVFHDILEQKKLPKGLTHGFGPKMAIFQTFILRKYRPGKCLLPYSRTKKRLSKL